MMTYELFYTEASIPQSAISPLHRRTLMNSESMGAAITAACSLIRKGAVVWQIIGSEGFMMERGDVETEYRRREAETKIAGSSGTPAMKPFTGCARPLVTT